MKPVPPILIEEPEAPARRNKFRMHHHCGRIIKKKIDKLNLIDAIDLMYQADFLIYQAKINPKFDRVWYKLNNETEIRSSLEQVYLHEGWLGQ